MEKTNLTILILLTIIGTQLILWAVSDMRWRKRMDMMQEKLDKKTKGFEDELRRLHGE